MHQCSNLEMLKQAVQSFLKKKTIPLSFAAPVSGIRILWPRDLMASGKSRK